MSDSEERRAALLAASREHPVVSWALHSLEPQGDGTFGAPLHLTEALGEKLLALEPNDDLIAAVLGIVELAGFLSGETNNSPKAGRALYGAVARATDAVAQAVADGGWEGEVLETLRADRFAAFSGQRTATPIERRAPQKGEVRAGPLARMAALDLDPKKTEPPDA